MELIIGGCFQGKLEYAKGKLRERHIVIEDDSIADGSLLADMMQNLPGQIRIIDHMHLFARQQVEENRTEEIFPLLERLLSELPELIIVCDEVGYGIVPVERQERQYREAVGRMLCFLAQRARHVERIVAGIPVKLK